MMILMCTDNQILNKIENKTKIKTIKNFEKKKNFLDDDFYNSIY